MKISACMIAKNEEKNIAKTINSYKDIVDEIIVVDTGSTDNTVSIARELGAKIYHFEWVDDFAKAKNYAISKAKGDWVIFLDADEYFDINQAKQIPNLINKYGRGKTKFISCKMININEKTGNIIATFIQTRIFKKDKGIYYVSPIHERLRSEEKGIKSTLLSEDELVIYHTGYSEDRIDEKSERNLKLLLNELGKDKIDPTVYYFLADTYFALKEYKLCINYGKLFLKNKVNLIGLNSKVYQNMIASMIKLKKDCKEIVNFTQEALNLFPKHPIFNVYLGEVYFSTKQYELALKNYKLAVEKQENYKDIEINHLVGRIHEVEYGIGRIYEYKNMEEKAVEYYISALKRNKTYVMALNRLLKLIKNLDDADIVYLLNQLYSMDNMDELRILVQELLNQRYSKVLAYYVNTMNKNFNYQDFSTVIMFLTNARYKEAFKHFYEAYLSNYENSYAKLAIVSGYLSKDIQMMVEMKDLVKPSYKRIIEVLFLLDEEVILYKEDLEDYLSILIEIVLLGKDSYLDKYIRLKNKFEKDIDYTMGNTLMNNRFYELAIRQYESAIGKDKYKTENIVDLYFNVGYCYYKINNVEKSLDYFAKALENGYLENDIKEYLQWIKSQTNNSKIKNTAYNLLNRFEDLKSKEKKSEA